MLSMTNDDLLTAEQVAEELGIKRQSVYRMTGRQAGFPQPKRHIGRTPLWDATEVRAWRKDHPPRRRPG